MTEFDEDKFRKAFIEAKLLAYITKSTDPVKEEKLERLRSLQDQATDLAMEILEGENREHPENEDRDG